MNTSKDKLTVKQAVAEYKLNAHSIRRWIRKKYVHAVIQGEEYSIDRVSLEAHLAKKQDNAPSEATSTPAKAADVPTSGTVGTVMKEEPSKSQVEAQPTVEVIVQPSQPDLYAGAKTVAEQPAQPTPALPLAKEDASVDKRQQRKQEPREQKKKIKKGPVRYAKDAMRHLNGNQMWDVIRWLQHRIETLGTKGAA